MKSVYARRVKRAVEGTIALTALVALFPLLLAIAAALAISYRGTPFFMQWRPGRLERHFRVVKFRTMSDARDAHGNLLPGHLRITRPGVLLRRTSLDELPQLWNVVRGEMSLIGPRPLLPGYLPLYDERQRRRHEVRPGITGWAQVNGRNAISWTQKLEHDVWYVDNLSLALDLKILWMTCVKVLRREGINAGEAITMVPFDGSN